MKNLVALSPLFLAALVIATADPDPQLTLQPVYLHPANPSYFGIRQFFGLPQYQAPQAPNEESQGTRASNSENEDPFAGDEVEMKAEQTPVVSVINGEIVPHGVLPGFAVFQNNNQFFCGGTLITSRHVLTAASCTLFFDVNNLGPVRVYVNTASLVPLDSGVRVRAIRRFWKHPGFNVGFPVVVENDIAIAELDAPIRNIRPIRLARSVFTFEDSPATVYGFGIYKTPDQPNFSDFSNELRRGSLTVISNNQCQVSYPWIGTNGVSQRNQYICATGEQNICFGDNGGPLFVGRRQVGIASFGWCYTEALGYTRVGYHIDWIRDVIFHDNEHDG